MKLPVIPPLKTWNPTKLHSHDECPLRTGLRYSLKMCPLCFKGTVGFDSPCTVCKKKEKKAPALQRGIEIDTAISDVLDPVTRDDARDITGLVAAPKAREAIVKMIEGTVHTVLLTKHQISLNDKWEPLPKFTKGPWFWGELDVLLKNLKKKLAKVVDWKTGGLDKKTGAVRAHPKYEEQLEIYGVAVLCTEPQIDKVEAQLVFVDATPPNNPIVTAPTLFRKSLEKLKKKLEGRIKPMMSDTVFAPRPGYYCGWCSYQKSKGGPCPY